MHQRLFASQALDQAEKILVYLSFGSEIDTHPLIDRWLEEGREVYVPVMVPKTRKIVPVRIFSDYRDLPQNAYGIQEPCLKEGERLAIDQLDLVIVPGLAFDSCGYRVGYGGGYYDRLIPKLKASARTLALCYGFQLVDRVPADDFDEPVQYILSEDQEVRI
jgi:5-formyltetrahydrofolate cyclo-ligase